MKLIDTVPVREISKRVREPLKHVAKTPRKAAAQMHPQEYSLGAYVLMMMAGASGPLAKLKMSGNMLEVSSSAPMADGFRTVAATEKITGMRVFGEILGAKGITRSGHQAYDVFLAELSDDFLYLGDVWFQDPARPLAKGEPALEGATHHGFGLFPEFLGNLEKYALEHGKPAIVLVAAGTSQRAFFSKHGFSRYFQEGEMPGEGETTGRVVMVKWIQEIVDRRKREMASRNGFMEE